MRVPPSRERHSGRGEREGLRQPSEAQFFGKVITLDPATGDASPRILRHLTSAHAGTAGVYAAVLVEGEVAAGDPICLL